MKQLAIRGLNHLVESESWAQERLRPHAGATLLIDGGLFTIKLTIGEHGLFHVGDAAAVPNVALTLPADSMIKALFEPDKLFSSVKLGGTVDVAESLAFVFRNLKWDAEADLARLVGDIPAHRLSMFGKALAGSLRGGVRKASENLAEYAVEESALVMSASDLQAFSNAVDQLADDLSRLEKRISRL